LFYSVVVVIVRFVLKIIFRINVYGKNQNVVIKNGNYIICGNHSSMFDPVLVAVTHNNHIRFMAKKELFKNPVFRYVFNKLKAFPIDREGNPLTAIKNSLRILKNNEILGMFPEGTRVKKHEESNAKGGIAVIAIKTKKPVLPVYIDSKYKFFSKVNIYYGDFIHLDEFYGKKLESEDYNEISEDIMDKIYSLKEDFNG
jgi:1-acyl-sn-glycerol-3-phosphate acyltransferase